MLLLLLIAFVACNHSAEKKTNPQDRQTVKAESAKSLSKKTQVVCPVCGLAFFASESEGSHEYEGNTYYFLITDHMNAFVADPQSFLSQTEN